MLDKIKAVVESEINPHLATEGGHADVVAVDDGVVKIRLTGSCATCPMRQLTVAGFIKTAIMRAHPDVKDVLLV